MRTLTAINRVNLFVNAIKMLFVGASASMAMLATAQFGGMPTPNTDYFPILFLNPNVVKDLHLSPSVASQEQNLVIQMGMQMLPLAQSMKKDPGRNSEAMKAAIKAYEDLERKSVAPLNPAQRARYHQLTLQYYGPAALAMPDTASRVGLTPPQREKIKELVAMSGRKMFGQLPQGSNQKPMDRVNAMRKAGNAARVTLDRQVDALLTPAQRGKWRALQGPMLPGITDMGGLGSMFGG